MKKNIIITVLALLLLISWAYIIGSPFQLRRGGWTLTKHAAVTIPREGQWSLTVVNSVDGVAILSSGLQPESAAMFDRNGKAHFGFNHARFSYLDEDGDGLIDTMLADGKEFAMQKPVWVLKEKSK